MMIHFLYNEINIMPGSPLEIKKAHEGLFNHIKNDNEFIFHNNINILDTIKIIESCNNDIFIVYASSSSFEKQMIDFVKNPQNNKIVFFSYDYWPHVRWDPTHFNQKYFVENMFYAKHHYIVTYALNLEQINEMWDQDFTEYKDKIICDNIWCSYPLSFIPFNKDPINKVLLFGNIVATHYPERYYMRCLSKVNKNVVELERSRSDFYDNVFNTKLSNYLCCFASSVYVYHKKFKQYRNTNIILLKVFEILASGSLLLYPKDGEDQLNKYGLFHMKNCIVSDMENISETIDFILHPENRNKIDEIRLNGQKHARENLDSIYLYKKIKNIVMCSNSIVNKTMDLHHNS
jgi:hypothetical protein